MMRRSLQGLRVYLGLVISCLTSISAGQSLPRNAGYAEFLGNGGGFLSINYERRLWPQASNHPLDFAARIGLSMSFNQYDHTPIIHLPFEVCSYIGTKQWRPDLGIGYTVFTGLSDLSDPRIPEEYRSNYAAWYVARFGVRRISSRNTLLRLSPMYIWETHSNCRQSDFWGAGVSFGSYF